MPKLIDRQDEHDALFQNIGETFKRLAKAIDAPETVDTIKKYLDVVSRCHNYSWRNVMLIETQNAERFEILPEDKRRGIEMVGSFQFWKKLKGSNNRHVQINKGEKGYRVVVPVTLFNYERDDNGNYRKGPDGKRIKELDPETGKPKTRQGFKLGSVFDVSQTNAKEIGAVPDCSHRTGKATYSEEARDNLIGRVQDKYDVTICHREGIDSNGYFTLKEGDAKNVIAINPDRSNDDQISTLFHELGHYLLHSKEPELLAKENRNTIEGEAEAFAYAMSSMLGIDNKSELYIRNWGNDGDMLMERLGKISSAVSDSAKTLSIDNFMKDYRQQADLKFPKMKAGHNGETRAGNTPSLTVK